MSNWGGQSQAQLEADISSQYNALVAESLGDFARHIAYPGGDYSAAVDAAMTALGMWTGRGADATQDPAENPLPIANQYLVNFISLSTTIDLPTAKSYVDSAIANETALVFNLHQLTLATTPPSAQFWTRDDFEALLDYIIAANVPIITTDELYELRNGPITVPRAYDAMSGVSVAEMTATDDTVMYSQAPTVNFGAGATIDIGYLTTPSQRRTLIRFSLASIPTGSTIVAANISLWLSEPGSWFGAGPAIIRAYAVLRNWIESEATWNIYSTGNSWGTAGCDNTTTDRRPDNIAVGGVDHTAPDDSRIDISIDAATVQEWLDGNLDNNGLLIKADIEATTNRLYRFHSSESASPSLRPKLTVVYY
jgi:hypothetical protein